MIGVFPFGQEVRNVVQVDRSPKRVFVLGVYASAVHARWVNPQGKTLVNALAVGSEPYIFWRGEGAEQAISAISIPKELGELQPASPIYNGPSGIALDNLYLTPMGLTRDDTWLCDLVPHSCVNPGQKSAIERVYLPAMHRHGLPMPSVPRLPAVTAQRRSEIMDEIRMSGAEILVLLGDQPIRWFLYPYTSEWEKLSDFGVASDEYGLLHKAQLDGTRLSVLPLAHPRQAGRLGMSSPRWCQLHEDWLIARCFSILR